MSDGVFIPGISNKYNSQESIKKIMETKKVKLEKLEDEKIELKDKRTLINEIKVKALEVQKKAKQLYGINAPFDDKVSLSSNEAAFSAKATKNAEIGEYNINIKQKALPHKVASQSLDRNYRLPAGDYLIRVGKESVKIPFNGGTVDDFDDAVRLHGKNILKTTITNDTRKTQVLILEGIKTGSQNHIRFGNEQTQNLFKKMGFYEEISSFEKHFALESPQLKHLTNPNKTPLFAGQGVLVLEAGDQYRFSLPENVPYKKKLMLEIDLRLQRLSGQELNQKEKPLPTGPNFKETGQTRILDIDIEGERPLIDIPAYKKKEAVKKTPQIIEDDHYLEIITDQRTIALDELDVSAQKKTLRFELNSLLNPNETITDIILKNNNTQKQLESSRIVFYDDDTKGGMRFLREFSKPRDLLLNLDGLDIVRQNNTIDDLLKGVTLNVFDQTGRRETLKIDRDYEKIMGSIVEFLGEYNQFLKLVNEHTDNQPDDEGNRGKFSSEYSLISLASKMRNIMMNPYPTNYGDELTILSQIGISTNAGRSRDLEKVLSSRGILEVDEDQFIKMMEKYADGIKQLFGKDTDDDMVVDTGAAFEMEKLFKLYTANNRGYFKLKNETLANELKQQDKKIDNYKEYLEEEEAKLKQDFLKLERAAEEFEKNSKKLDNMLKSK